MALLPTFKNVLVTGADQALSSLTNIVGTVAAARSLSTEALGAFALVMLLYQICLLLNRALVCDPLLVQERIHGDPWRRSASAAAGSGVVVGLGAAAVLALGSVALAGGGVRPGLVALALAMPLLCVQDVGRYISFAQGVPQRALGLDSIWLGLQVGALLTLDPTSSPLRCVLLVVVPGAISGVTAAFWFSRPRPIAVQWLATRWPLSRYYLIDAGTAALATSGTAVALAGIGGLATVGVVRVSQVLFGPVNVAFAAALASLVPPATASVADRPAVRRLGWIASSLPLLVACVVGGVASIVPDRLGRRAFGETWPALDAVLLPATLAAATPAVCVGAVVVVRALKANRYATRARIALLPFTLGLPLLGGAVAGAAGYLVGVSVAGGIMAMAWWRLAGRLLGSAPDGS